MKQPRVKFVTEKTDRCVWHKGVQRFNATFACLEDVIEPPTREEIYYSQFDFTTLEVDKYFGGDEKW